MCNIRLASKLAAALWWYTVETRLMKLTRLVGRNEILLDILLYYIFLIQSCDIHLDFLKYQWLLRDNAKRLLLQGLMTSFLSSVSPADLESVLYCNRKTKSMVHYDRTQIPSYCLHLEQIVEGIPIVWGWLWVNVLCTSIKLFLKYIKHVCIKQETVLTLT